MSNREIIAKPKKDRRMLSFVPDPEKARKNMERRGLSDELENNIDFNQLYQARLGGQLYIVI